MNRTRTLLALLVIQMFALGAIAQSAAQSAEFGRASGGSIEVITKAPRRFSGSLSLSRSTGALGSQGYEAALGGSLVADRVWFFAAASDLTAIDARMTAQPVDWTSVTASLSRLQQPPFETTLQPNAGVLPSSFLSLRSTSILSDRASVSFSFSRSTVDQ